ncbi:TonB-dependent receptor domain-containing protein [Yoonia vestfoldensis]|uniref:TonB-dependent heme receptor A n=1 Tax=Yoonia vestfoldensis TaxID=245188 RepID=A0A1Y0ECH1_9RHOB|nr:TonB-dependent receptor [Yoonia vestfoldensis]ARU01208.1 TonB-dependent heme receptor A [Yoonia vestfoldensis]
MTMRIRPRRLGLACLLTTTAILAAGMATAQQAQVDSGTFLGRLIFGAGQQKVAIDTPQAVSVLDQQDIDREQAANVGQILRNVPGAQTAGSDRPLGFAFNIRGIGATEQSASEARIIVNVDGVPKFYEQYRMGSFFSDPELYRRVEILRGPGSATLYGSGAIGGVVRFETKDASDFIPEDGSGALRLKYGYDSNGNGHLGSMIYAARPVEGAEFLAALGYRRADDYDDGAGATVAGSGFEAPSALLKGTFQLGDLQTLRLSAQRFSSDADNASLAQTGGGDAITNAFGTVDRSVTDDTFSIAWDHAGGGWFNPRVQLSYSDTTVEQSNARSTSGAPQTCLPTASNANVFCDVTYAYRTAMLTAENTAAFSGAGWDNFLTFGMQATTQDRVADSAGLLGFHPEGSDRKIGVYAQAEIVIGDRLTLIPGARIDFAEREPGAEVPNGATVTDEASALTLAALYDVTDDLAVFGSVARTERLPTLDELYSFSGTKSAALDLDKEEATNVELGLTYSRDGLFAAGDNLQLKLTAFRNRIDDFVTVTPSSDTVFFRNLAQADFEGAEIEAGYEAHNLFGRLALSSVRGTDGDFGYTLATTPADQAAVTLGRRLPDRGLEFGWRGTFVDDITTSTRNVTSGVVTDTSFAGYTTQDVFVTWRPDDGALAGFDLQLAVENLQDTAYRNNLSLDQGRGRTFKISLARSLTW